AGVARAVGVDDAPADGAGGHVDGDYQLGGDLARDGRVVDLALQADPVGRLVEQDLPGRPRGFQLDPRVVQEEAHVGGPVRARQADVHRRACLAARGEDVPDARRLSLDSRRRGGERRQDEDLPPDTLVYHDAVSIRPWGTFSTCPSQQGFGTLETC